MSENISFRRYLDKQRHQPMIALVMTDVIKSTFIVRTKGDDAWREILEKHLERLQFYKKLYGGYEVDRAGEGGLTAFLSGDKALRFLLDLTNDTGDPLIRIRAGIDVGRVQLLRHSDGMCGGMIHLLKRMLEVRKKPGIILTSAAKSDIERQLGAGVVNLGRIKRFRHRRLKDFENNGEMEVLYEIIKPGN